LRRFEAEGAQLLLRACPSDIVARQKVQQRGWFMHPLVGLWRLGPLIAMLAVVLLGTPAAAQTKVALVIGNSAYRSVPVLPNPAHDAADVAASLERLGFSVRQVTDATYDDMRRALLEFGRKANDAEMAVVFFAGHGMEVGGENWLVPVDAELRIDVNAEQEAIALRSVMLAVSSASKLGMVMLDACRNNPFLVKMNRTAVTRSVDRGLARIEPTSNVLVAYASKDGTVAADGAGRNSPFTSALLEHMETPGLEINFLFRNVRDEVVAATKGAQQPFVYGSLSKEAIYLKPPAAASALPGPDEAAWGLLKETTDDAALRRFAEQYPNSPWRPQAQARIAALAAAQAAKPVPPSADEITWAILQETNDQAALKRFLAQYPNTTFRQQAEARMAALAAQPAEKQQVSRTSVSSPTSADFYTFTSALASADSRWCIDVPGAEFQPGKSLSLFGCTGTPNQIFGFANRSNLTAGGLCLDGRSANRGKPPVAGDPVVIAECDGSDHQVWELEPFDSEPSLISVVAPSGLCVTVDGADAGPRTPLVLAQCDDLKSQGWVPGDMARPPRPARPPAPESASRGGDTEFAEAEYYWFEGHRYCWYDDGWHGAGWYWCGNNLNKGAGWGGPIGWHFWYHFGHRILNHPVFFAAHHGKPPHEHMAAGTAAGKGNQSGKGGKSEKGEPGNKSDRNGKNEAHEPGKGDKEGRNNKDNKSATKEGSHKVDTGKSGQTSDPGNLANKEKIVAKSNQNGGPGNQVGNSHGGGGGHHGSDIRLKEDIVPLARLDDGIGLYRFRYKGSNHRAYVGVLAQEVMEIVPGAVSLGRNGYLQVDYDRLGLKFMSWKTWLRHNGAELRPADE
jgi:hypothetical protein